MRRKYGQDQLNEELFRKWAPILDHPQHGDITDSLGRKDPYRRAVVATVLETTERELGSAAELGASQNLLGESMSSAIPANFMGASSSTHGDGNIDIFDPVLISLVRRSMPNLIAYDICGVQPMTGPTGLIFALRTRYSNQTGAENNYQEVDTSFSSVTAGNTTLGQFKSNSTGGGYPNTGTTGPHGVGGYLPGNTTSTSNLAGNSVYNYAQAMATAQAEALGTDANSAFAQMGFSIEKVTVTARSRALKAEYTMELAQDLKAIHGLDAETELSNILSSEILADINREVVRLVNITAVPGAQENVTTTGIFDLDVDSGGRWSVEKFKGLHFQIERECNQIAKQTRRGKGNIMICSSDVASALQMTGTLSFTPALNANKLVVDDTGNTFAGVLNGRIRVYIDPYSTGGQYMTIGYKGASAFDAGLFYCPYVPLQMVRAVDQDSFQPKIGFKTRYGIVANPFAQGFTQGLGALVQDSNVYYRRILVTNLL